LLGQEKRKGRGSIGEGSKRDKKEGSREGGEEGVGGRNRRGGMGRVNAHTGGVGEGARRLGG